MYKALTVIGLPKLVEREVWTDIFAKVPSGEILRKEPGDKITKAELSAAGQTDDMIKDLIKYGSISEDMDADLHPDHIAVSVDERRAIGTLEETRSADDVEGDKYVSP